jgi:hypothetical protein
MFPCETRAPGWLLHPAAPSPAGQAWPPGLCIPGPPWQRRRPSQGKSAAAQASSVSEGYKPHRRNQHLSLGPILSAYTRSFTRAETRMHGRNYCAKACTKMYRYLLLSFALDILFHPPPPPFHVFIQTVDDQEPGGQYPSRTERESTSPTLCGPWPEPDPCLSYHARP